MISILLYNTANSQAHTGFEVYNYAGYPLASAMPVKAWYQSAEKWYGEVRFNYDEAGTYSLYGGRSFSKEGNLSFSFTPFGGLVMGRYKGLSAGANIDLKFKKIFFSSDSQYTLSAENANSSFFFAWSELGYQLNGNVFAGLALQQTRYYRAGSTWAPGVQIGISYKSWSFPFFVFNPIGNERSFVLGITWERSMNSSTCSTEKL